MSEWTARRILKDLADGNRRKRVLTAFWKYGEATAKAVAVAQLAKALHFREDSLRKLPAEKKAELLAGRIGSPEFEATFETALMLYHTREASDMMAQFLDRWNVPHVNGSIEVDDYKAPSTDQVRDAVRDLTTFDKQDVALYLASAGLLMDEAWRASAWPVVDEIAS